jgi:pimeloyl-ACP methyl ester carboxylesterase
MKRILLAAVVVLTACNDAPTANGPTGTTRPGGPTVGFLPGDTPQGCPAGTTGASGTLPGSGALFLICIPPNFDPATGSLVVYAHGSVPPQAPLAIPQDEIDNVSVAQIVTGSLGFAYATTSYRENGLVVVDAEKDLQRLVSKFTQLFGPVRGNTYAVGVSEGGLIATLATERHPQLFDGTLALCAPIGDFQREINYFDDFRLAFDFYFPTLGGLLGDPLHIPDATINQFNTTFAAALTAALANPSNWPNFNALLAASDIPLQLPDSSATLVGQTILRLLAYNVLFTNQAQETLGGQPYDNVAPVSYSRSIDGLSPIPSISADRSALAHLQAMYQTSGRLSSPLVTLFNVNDPIVPSFHETLYAAKVAAAGGSEFLVAQIPSTTFGHCLFSLQEVLAAFGALSTAVGR